MVFFPRLDRQKSMDIIQCFRAGNKLYWEGRNVPQVTFSSGSTKMCTSVRKEANSNESAKKFEQAQQDSQTSTNIFHHKGMHFPFYDSLLPSNNFLNQPALLEGTNVSPSWTTSRVTFNKTPTNPTQQTFWSNQETEEKKFQCENCEVICKDAESLQHHIQKNHKGARSYPCAVCGECFGKPSGLKDHMHFHSGDKPLTCEVCEKSFTQFNKLCQHNKIPAIEAEQAVLPEEQNTEKKFQCQNCEVLFENVDSLQHHIQKHHKGAGSYQCPECVECFKTPSGLKYHMLFHSGGKLFTCKVCKKSFTQYTLLYYHNKIHTNQTQKDVWPNHKKFFQCENCGVRFDDVASLQHHIQKNHKGARSYPCAECGKSFAKPSGLKQHSHIHSSEKPFKCEVCQKSYTQFSNLCRHKRMNSECQTKMKCEICRRTFRSSSASTNRCKTCLKKDSNKVVGDQPNKLKRQKEVNQQESLSPKTPERKNALSELVFNNSPFRQLEKLCYSVPKITSPTRSPTEKTLPPRKRLWDAAFPFTSPNSSTKAGPKAVSTKQAQFNAESNAKNSKTDFSSNIFNTKLTNGILSPKTPPNYLEKNKVASASKISSPSSIAFPFHLSSLPSKKRFLQRAHPNAAAKAVADEYVYCSSIAKKPQCISVSNHHTNRFKPANDGSLSNLKTHTEKNAETDNRPLDLSVKKRKRCNSETSLSREDNEKSNDWKKSLSLFYQVGHHYGSVLPANYQRAVELYNQTNLATSTLNPEKYCQQPLSRLCLPLQLLSSSVPTSESSNQKPQTPSSIPGLSLPVNEESVVGSKHLSPLSTERHCCPFCLKSFPKITNLERHMRTHTGEQPYSCQYCNKCFSISSNMQRHIKNIHINKEKTFPCVVCGRIFDQQESFEKHIQNHGHYDENFGRLQSCSKMSSEQSNEAYTSFTSSSPDSSLVQERRLSSSSFHDSSNSATPFRLRKQGGELTDDSFSSPLSAKSTAEATESEKFSRYFYPEISDKTVLLQMNNRALSSLNALSGAGTVQA